MVIKIHSLDTEGCTVLEEHQCDRYSVSDYGLLRLYSGQGLSERLWMVYKDYYKFEVIRDQG